MPETLSSWIAFACCLRKPILSINLMDSVKPVEKRGSSQWWRWSQKRAILKHECEQLLPISNIHLQLDRVLSSPFSNNLRLVQTHPVNCPPHACHYILKEAQAKNKVTNKRVRSQAVSLTSPYGFGADGSFKLETFSIWRSDKLELFMEVHHLNARVNISGSPWSCWHYRTRHRTWIQDSV